jgi:uncharacterized membrane protein YdbT with pleckstrin-like domain
MTAHDVTGGSDEAGPPQVPGAGPARPDRTDSEAGWRRLSRRSMVVRPLTDLVRLLPLLAGLLILHAQTGAGLAWGVVASVFAVVTGLVHWGTTRYLITAERVYLRRGLLNQKTLSVARDRIRTVDVTAHLLHRLLGVCRVSIGTGRNDLRSGESFHLDGITRSEAESLRIVLLAAGAGVPPVADVARVADVVRLRLSWLRFAPLTMTGLVVLGVLFGGVIQITNATDINLAATGPVRQIVADFTALSVVQRILAAGAVALPAYMLIAMAGYVAVFWNFRLTGLGTDTLRVTRGLLSIRATTIAVSRLRGVEISEPLLLRAARGARCVAIATGLRIGRGAEREGSVLSPPAPRAVAQHVASTVLGLPADLCSGPLEPHGPAARRRRYIRALAGAILVIAAIYVTTRVQDGPAWVWITSFVLVPAGAAVAADRYRSLGHRLAGGWLVTRFGCLARRRNIISADAIIGWRIHQTWFQRRQGLMTLTATTAAGQQHYSVRDVPVAEGLALAVAATGDLLVPFLRAPSVQDLSPLFSALTGRSVRLSQAAATGSERSGEALVFWLVRLADRDDVVRAEPERSMRRLRRLRATRFLCRHLAGPEPSLLAFPAHGQDSGQERGSIGSRRGQRAHLGGDGRRELHAELLSSRGPELVVPAEEAVRRGGGLVGEPGELQMLRPAEQRGRDDGEDRGEVGPSGHPFLDHEGAGEHVAKPLALGRHHRGDQPCRDPDQVYREQPDLDKRRRQGADECLPESLGAAIIADDPDAERHLAERLAPAERLEDDRVADHHEQKAGQVHRRGRGSVQVTGARSRDDDGDEDQGR